MTINKIMKKWKLCGLFIFVGMGIFGCTSNSSINNEEVIKEILEYNHKEVVPKLLKEMESSDSNDLVAFYKDNDKEMKKQFSKYFSKEALDEYLLNSQPNLLTQFTEYTLPLEMEETEIEDGASQIITINFKDAKDKEGSFVFQVQNKEDTISYLRFKPSN